MEIGTKLGHYEIIDRLGAGGMGEVHRAPLGFLFVASARHCQLNGAAGRVRP